MLWRMGEAMPSSLSEKAYIPLAAPLIKSPTRWPGSCRSSISGGRTMMLTMAVGLTAPGLFFAVWHALVVCVAQGGGQFALALDMMVAL